MGRLLASWGGYGPLAPPLNPPMFPFMMFALPSAKISRRSLHPALRYHQPYKQTNKQKKANLISRQTLHYGEIIIHTIKY